MDFVGAVADPLSAAPLMVRSGTPWLFAISVMPGLCAGVAVLA